VHRLDEHVRAGAGLPERAAAGAVTPAEIAATAETIRACGSIPDFMNRWLALTPEALAENEARRSSMAIIGAKEAQRRALREGGREARSATAKAMVAAVDGPKKVEPPAEPAKESSVSKKAKKKPAAKAKAKAAAAPKPAKKAAKGVDRSPLMVGTFITRPGGCSMAELEKEFKMDAHPLRSKIWTAKHVLGFTIEYDAKEKRYTGTAPRFKQAAE
jgi:hypothetical protein